MESDYSYLPEQFPEDGFSLDLHLSKLFHLGFSHGMPPAEAIRYRSARECENEIQKVLEVLYGFPQWRYASAIKYLEALLETLYERELTGEEILRCVKGNRSDISSRTKEPHFRRDLTNYSDAEIAELAICPELNLYVARKRKVTQ